MSFPECRSCRTFKIVQNSANVGRNLNEYPECTLNSLNIAKMFADFLPNSTEIRGLEEFIESRWKSPESRNSANSD